MSSNPTIHIIDSPCGAGKSTQMGIMINELGNKYNYIYVTPYKEDFDKIRVPCRHLDFYEPKERPTKLQDIKRLIKKNMNIVTTHELFKRFDKEVCKLFKGKNYILIIDEVIDMIEQIKLLDPIDLDIMLKYNIITIDDTTKEATWNKNYMGSMGLAYKDYFDKGKVYIYKEHNLIYTHSTEIYSCFNDVYICTYMFSAQNQKYYFDLYGIKYDMYSVENYKIIPYKYQKINTNINILDNDLYNAIGDYYMGGGKLYKSALSKNWYKKHKNDLDSLRKITRNILRNIWGAKSSEILVVTFKEFQELIQDKGFISSFISCNTKSVNKFGDRSYMAFLVNIYMNPNIKGFLEEHKIEVDEDDFALSMLIQVLFRSILRNGGTLNLFIPSRRMREILKDFIIQSKITRRKVDRSKLTTIAF